ncbi:T6SS immunity protein Tli3 family protein [Variovorax sp. GB1P17]|uniref:T6SS immunity protein Tli3 family protein n=1 Tax=Variovorax sp. GB1P17 TaxID=3443740 RepID=UPI003F479D1B
MKKKTCLSALAAALLLLAGCTNQNVYPSPALAGAGGIVNKIDDKHYFVAEPDKGNPCAAPNIHYVDQVARSRQLAIDWDTVKGYTLPGDRREKLARSIRAAQPTCPKPYRIESQNIIRTYEGTKTLEARGFVLYWLEGDVIHFKALQFSAERDGSVGTKLSVPYVLDFRYWDELNPNADRDAPEKGEAYRGPVAAPQVVYRIDDNRYFEFVPRQSYFCITGTLMYVDRQQDIRTKVEDWGRNEYSGRDNRLVVDAANTRYLLAPWRDNISGVSSGGGGARTHLSYSADGGRTWQSRSPTGRGGRMAYIHDDNLYLVLDDEAWIANLPTPEIPGWNWEKNWAKFKLKERSLPAVGKWPIDKQFHCKGNGNE